MSPYEQKLSHLCYNHFLDTDSRGFTYFARNGNDLINASNAIESMEEDGYISNVTDNGFSFSFTIEDSLIQRMKQGEF